MSYNEKVLGDSIRAEREKIGLSREKYSELIGLTASYIGMVERGEKTPSLKTFRIIAKSFEKPMDDFFIEVLNDPLDNLEFEDKIKLREIRMSKINGFLIEMTNEDIEFFYETIKLYKQKSIYKKFES